MKYVASVLLALCFLVSFGQDFPKVELDDGKDLATSVLFSPNGKLIVGSYSGKIFFWNVENQSLDNFLEEEKGVIVNMSTSPDGEILATGGKNEDVFIWSTTKGIVKKKVHGHKGPVSCLAINYESKLLATGGKDKSVIIWDLVTGDQKAHFEHDKSISSMTFAHKSNFLAVGDEEGLIKIYNMTTSELDRKFNPKAGKILSVAFSPNDKFLVSGQSNKTVKLWDLGFGACKHTLEGHKKEVFNVAFSPDGKYVASASLDNKLIIWDLKTAMAKAELKGFYHLISASFSYDGKYLAVADSESKVKVFDVSSLGISESNQLNILAQHSRGVLNNPPNIEMVQPLVKAGETYLYQDKFLKVKGKVSCEAGLFLLLVNGTEVKVDAKGYFEKDVKIPYMESEIVIKAIDREKQVTENVIKVNKPFDGKQVAAGDYRHGRDYALIIGTNEYAGMTNLVNPEFDAKAISEELTDRYGFTSELLLNPSKKDILLAIRKFSTMKFGDQDQLFIFMAGHGIYDKPTNQGYLVCADSDKDDVVRLSYLSYESLKANLDGIPCKHIFLVLDACFGGTFGSVSHRGTEVTDVNRNQFILRKMKYKTRHYLTSGGQEYVADGRPGEHSPFTRHFLQALRSSGGEDKVLTQSELEHFVEKNPTQPNFGEFGSNEPGSDFLFIVDDE